MQMRVDRASIKTPDVAIPSVQARPSRLTSALAPWLWPALGTDGFVFSHLIAVAPLPPPARRKRA